MVGEIEVATAGQHATIVFLSDYILFRFPSLKSARVITGQPLPNLAVAGKLLALSEIALKAQIGDRKPVELFPKPSWLVRILSPAIRSMLGHIET